MKGVIIGRFQTPYLHPGHLWLISEALRQSTAGVTILLGCTEDDIINERNPYPAHVRKQMIYKIFPQIKVISLYDHPSDEVWSDRVDTLLNVEHYSIMLYHSRDSFINHYSGKYPTTKIEEVPGYSATKIRNNEI